MPLRRTVSGSRDLKVTIQDVPAWPLELAAQVEPRSSWVVGGISSELQMAWGSCSLNVRLISVKHILSSF